MNWFTKNKILTLGFIVTIVHFFSRYSVDIGICDNYATNCNDIFVQFTIFTLIFISVFIFSLVTFKLKESVFVLWRNFSFITVPIFLIIIYFLPTNTHGMDFLPVVRGTVIAFLTSSYSIISIILILYKSFKKEV